MKTPKFYLTFMVALLLSLPAAVVAQSQSPAAADAAPAKPAASPEAKAPRQTSGPFRGKVAAMNKTARTITIGKRTFQVTSETKITRGTGPAAFESGALREDASGYFVTSPDGKLTLKSLRFGPKPGTNSEKATKKAS